MPVSVSVLCDNNNDHDAHTYGKLTPFFIPIFSFFSPSLSYHKAPLPQSCFYFFVIFTGKNDRPPFPRSGCANDPTGALRRASWSGFPFFIKALRTSSLISGADRQHGLLPGLCNEPRRSQNPSRCSGRMHPRDLPDQQFLLLLPRLPGRQRHFPSALQYLPPRLYPHICIHPPSYGFHVRNDGRCSPRGYWIHWSHNELAKSMEGVWFLNTDRMPYYCASIHGRWDISLPKADCLCLWPGEFESQPRELYKNCEHTFLSLVMDER